MHKNGFTLAEVLITLGILGVIMAMTLPAVISSYKHKVLEVQFKKAYSIISQVIEQANNDSGTIINIDNYGRTGIYNDGDVFKLYKLLKPYFMNALCPNNNSSCLEQVTLDDGSFQNSKTYKTYNGKVQTSTYFFDNGTFSNGKITVLLEAHNAKMLMITFDVNGIKQKPNRWGHDLFTFSINNKTGRLIPNGVSGSFSENPSAYCTSSDANSNKDNGLTCSYYAVNDKNYFKNLPK